MPPAPKRRWPRFTLRTLFVVVGIPLILIGAAFYLYNSVNSSIRNAYAGWWVADMVVEHMKAHDGAWPKGWNDLDEPYEICVRRSGATLDPPRTSRPRRCRLERRTQEPGRRQGRWTSAAVQGYLVARWKRFALVRSRT
jgi:hypothetical protein